MNMAILTIIVGVTFPTQITITFESLEQCLSAKDNLHHSFYRKHDRKLILTSLRVTCKEI